MNAAWDRRRILVIVFCAFLAYLPCLFGDFVFDDGHSVRDNEAIGSLANIPAFYWDVDMFSSLNCRLYRPVLLTSYALDAAIGGMQPWAFKLSNLLLHTLVSILVYQLACRMRASSKAALVGAVIFAVHPLASEAVNTISGRSNVLMVCALLLGLRFHLAALEGRRYANLGTIAATLLACGSKEPGMILPVLLLIQEGLAWGRSPGPVRGRELAAVCSRVLPSALLVVAYVLLRAQLLGAASFGVTSWQGGTDVHAGYGRDMQTQLSTMALLLPRTLVGVVWPLWPLGPTMDSHLPYTSAWASPPVVCGALCLLLLTALGLRAPRRRPLTFLGTCLAWGTALPWIIKPLNAPYLEHRFYGSLVGLSLVLIPVLPRLQLRPWPRPGKVLLALLVLVLALLSARRSLEFQTEAKLWTKELERNPQSTMALAGLAVCHLRQGRLMEVRSLLEELIIIMPEHAKARMNLAEAELGLGEKGRPYAALLHARVLVDLAPRNPFHRLLLSRTLTAVGVLEADAKRYDQAVEEALYCLQIAEPKGLVYRTAAHARMQQGDLDAAIVLLDESLARGLNHSSVRIDRCDYLARAGHKREAELQLQRLLMQEPFNERALQLLMRLRGRAAGQAGPPGK